MTAPGSASASATGARVGAAMAGAARPLTPAPPPNPRIQAMQFAIELAKIRGASATGNDRVTSVEALVRDAESINSFLGTQNAPT